MCTAGSFLGCGREKESENSTGVKSEVELDGGTDEKDETEINNKNEPNNEPEQVIKKSFKDSIELPYLGGKKYVNQVGRGPEAGQTGAKPFEFETGYFAYYQDDYDSDGSDEILALTFNDKSTKDMSIITYRMYEEDKEGWKQVAAFDMQMESWAEKYWCDFLYHKINGVPYFFQEQKQVSTYFSDGMTWILDGIKYEDGYFKQIEGGFSFAGSDEPDFYALSEWKKEFTEIGLNIGNIGYEQHSFDLSPGIIKLANIQADLNADFYDSPYETGEEFIVDGIDIIISDYTSEGQGAREQELQ